MIDLLIMIGICSFLANQIEIKSKQFKSIRDATKKDWSVKLYRMVLLMILILFSGMRTTYNDTETYMQAYQFLNVNNVGVASIFEPYGGFTIFQMLLKKYITEDPQVLILVTSIIVNLIFIQFYIKYSKHFGLTIFSYLILGPYLFSMAGIKQIMAMAFSLFAIENLLKKKYLKFFIWVIIAMTFHPYIICLVILPFLMDKVWNKKFVMILAVAVLISMNLETVLNFAGVIGKDYSIEEMTSYTVNPLRVLVELVPVVFSWVYRKKINTEEDSLLHLGINMMVINTLMISMGLFFDPIYFARIGTYFSVLNAIVIPMMLNVIYYKTENARANIIIYYVFFYAYFILDMTKLGKISITYDLFNHIRIF